LEAEHLNRVADVVTGQGKRKGRLSVQVQVDIADGAGNLDMVFVLALHARERQCVAWFVIAYLDAIILVVQGVRIVPGVDRILFWYVNIRGLNRAVEIHGANRMDFEDVRIIIGTEARMLWPPRIRPVPV
jgi:hypothetical protein